VFFANQRTILPYNWQLLHRRRKARFGTQTKLRVASSILRHSIKRSAGKYSPEGGDRNTNGKTDPRTPVPQAPAAPPSSTIAAQNQKTPKQNLRQSQPRGIEHRCAQNPKRSLIYREKGKLSRRSKLSNHRKPWAPHLPHRTEDANDLTLVALGSHRPPHGHLSPPPLRRLIVRSNTRPTHPGRRKKYKPGAKRKVEGEDGKWKGKQPNLFTLAFLASPKAPPFIG